MKISNFELEEKLDLHLDVKFDGGGSESQKPYLDPLNGPCRPPIDQKMKLFNFVLESKLHH